MASTRLRLAPYGPPATAALAEVIEETKAGDPLAPVTVAPPGAFAALSLRRVLAVRSGVANVRFIPLARIAELLGASRVAADNRLPLSTATRRAAIRATLRDRPGIFAEVADDPATVRALDDTLRDLRRIDDDALGRLASRGERADEVVRVFRDSQARLDRFYDERSVTEAAATAVEEGDPGLADLGTVILHLPRGLDLAEERLLAALAGRDALRAVLGLTSDGEADGPTWELATRLEPWLGMPDRTDASPATIDRIVMAPDPEEEVRAAVRQVPAAVRNGTPAYRMAIVSPTTSVYPATAVDVLAESGLPHHGLETATLAHSAAGRIVTGVVTLARGSLPRHDVMRWLHAAPIVAETPDRIAPADRWDRRSRQAGVTGGPKQWDRRLHALAERRLRRARDARNGGDDDAASGHEAAAAECEDLRTFIAELGRRLSPPAGADWRHLAEWATVLLHRYAGGESALAAWPDHEIEAHRRVASALEALALLDEVDSEPDLATFGAALDDELDAPAPRERRFGEGVLVGRIRDLVGADLDAVHVMGAVEGRLPTRAAPGALVTDDDREALDGVLERPAERRARERRDFLAALMTGATTSVVSVPRADIRAGRPVQPAPWLLEIATRLHGRPVHAETLSTLSVPWLVGIPSGEAALRATPDHASIRERDLTELLAKGVDRAAIPGLAPAVSVARARAGDEAGPWDGVVGPAPGLDHRALSPTSLERWAECPFRYFLAHVLDVEHLDDPEDIDTLPANERGSLMHEILDRFVGAHAERLDPDQPWTDADHVRLDEIADECFEEWEDRGLTGRALLWEIERTRIRRELHRFLDHDHHWRTELGVRPVATELGFTEHRGGTLDVELADGRTVRMRGFIDRLDAAPDGSRLRVVDYKTGSPIERSKKNPFQPDPFRGGTKLQLPVYALAARRDRDSDAPVQAEYWYVNERWGFKREEMVVDDALLADFSDLLGRIVTGVEGGVFPANPGDDTYDYRTGGDTWEHCMWCPYDRVCTIDRGDNWGRKRRHPALAPYRAVAGADGTEDASGDPSAEA